MDGYLGLSPWLATARRVSRAKLCFTRTWELIIMGATDHLYHSVQSSVEFCQDLKNEKST